MRKVNWLTISIAAYVVAIVLYAFKNIGSPVNGFYHNLISTAMLFVVFFGALKKNKTELDKSLLIGVLLIKVFSLICHLIWLLTGHNQQNQPYIFCIIVAVCMFLGIIINKKLSWK